MPLIIITGYPSSGKTHRALQLAAFFNDKISAAAAPSSSSSSSSAPTPEPRLARLKVHHISEQSLDLSRDVYREVRTEKDARAAQYSAVKRVLGKDDLVIADGLNFIKGLRYQLYCEAKAMSTPSCVVHVGTPVAKCRELNALPRAGTSPSSPSSSTNPPSTPAYPDAIFNDLIYRYEEPNGMSRWDSPLFTVLHDDPSPPLDAIWDALIGSDPSQRKTAKPNLATVLQPASSADYLYNLDRTTQDVLTCLTTYMADHPGEGGGEVVIPGVERRVELGAAPAGFAQLQRLRRQFISLNRQHVLAQERIGALFVDYLNDNFAA